MGCHCLPVALAWSSETAGGQVLKDFLLNNINGWPKIEGLSIKRIYSMICLAWVAICGNWTFVFSVCFVLEFKLRKHENDQSNLYCFSWLPNMVFWFQKCPRRISRCLHRTEAASSLFGVEFHACQSCCEARDVASLTLDKILLFSCFKSQV